jgi:tetratricopeptide (TPR) repeat protein
MNFRLLACSLGVAVILGLLTRPWPNGSPPAPSLSAKQTADNTLAIILAPHQGDAPVDVAIRRQQEQISHLAPDAERVVGLGRMFLNKERLSNDPGYYKLAEQCALWAETRNPADPEAMLLRGQVSMALHRFAEAEQAARKLTQQRSDVRDHALLGDALLDQGRLEQAIAAYQTMIELKLYLPSYARVAHVRWLKGDLEGAIEVIEQALQTGHPADPEPLAWVATRLAFYELERRNFPRSERAAERALRLVPDYPAALFVRAKTLLAQQRPTDALPLLERAVRKNPLPEYQWLLADMLRLTNNETRAKEIDAVVVRSGRALDPRTYALYLATRNVCRASVPPGQDAVAAEPQSAAGALQAAEEEFRQRQDVFTHDALAWACFATGDLPRAQSHARLALREGTRDPRLWLHAGIIAAAAGDTASAATYLEQARGKAHLLFPSEQARLQQVSSPSSPSSTARGQGSGVRVQAAENLANGAALSAPEPTAVPFY